MIAEGRGKRRVEPERAQAYSFCGSVSQDRP